VQPEAFWRDGIRALTGQPDDAAWTLVVDDVTRPAFMQAPLESPEVLTRDFKPRAMMPDELDLLPTANDHDIKISRMAHSIPEDWIYTLISLQTMSGYYGKGNYGIARMSSRSSSRPLVTLLSSNRWGQHFIRDVHLLLHERPQLLAGPWGYQDNGIVLIWLSHWNRRSSLSLKELDPFFIEIARAVRLREKAGNINAWLAITETDRLNATEAKGNLGDPWIPIKHEDSSALAVPRAGLTPSLLRDLLFMDGYDGAAMQRPIALDQGKTCYFHVSVLVSYVDNGKRKTGGIKSVSLPIPSKAFRSFFQRDTEFDRLAKLSKLLLNDSNKLQNQVLLPALYNFFEGGPDRPKDEARKQDKAERKRQIKTWVNIWIKQFSEAWHREYFNYLWRALDETDDEVVRRNWVQALKKQAEHVLERAIASAPGHSGRRLRSITRAESMFRGAFYNQFSDLLKEQQDVHTPS